ncbi:hypothetical protein D3C72_1872510 [compost metagenome]
MALEFAPFGDLQLYPLALNGVSVFNGDLGMIQRQRADLLAVLLRLMQALHGTTNQLFIQH